VSHPCDRYRREAMGAERLLPILDWVEALEVFTRGASSLPITTARATSRTSTAS